MHPDDDLLVKSSRDGDLKAFDELVKRYEIKVYNIAYRFTGNHADASDLAQDAFIRAYRALPSFRGEASFATWLFRITANVCRDELRRQQRQKKVSLDEMMSQPGGNPSLVSSDRSPQECLAIKEIQDFIQRQMDSLSPDQRLILVMREIQGLSYDEIASALDCSLGTVKSRLNRARQSLKQKVLEQRELLDNEIRLLNKGKEG